MKFRAELQGVPDLKRPVRHPNTTLVGAEEWARTIFENYKDREAHPDAHVDIYETKEVFLWSRRPPEKEKP